MMHAKQKLGRATRIVKVQGLAAVAGNTLTPSTGLRVDWPVTGTVLWIIGSVSGVITNDLYQGGLSSLGFRIQVQGRSELVTSGVGADFIQFAAAFPTAGFRLPVNIEVQQTEAWFVYIRNTSAATSFTPDIGFGVAEKN